MYDTGVSCDHALAAVASPRPELQEALDDAVGRPKRHVLHVRAQDVPGSVGGLSVVAAGVQGEQ